MAINHKIKSYFGFAVKSRQIVFGADMVITCKKKIYLIAYVADINRTSKNRLTEKSNAYGIPMVEMSNEELAEAVCRTNCKCVGITEPHLAQAINKELRVVDEQ